MTEDAIESVEHSGVVLPEDDLNIPTGELGHQLVGEDYSAWTPLPVSITREGSVWSAICLQSCEDVSKYVLASK